jgi:hypothetical protein
LFIFLLLVLVIIKLYLVLIVFYIFKASGPPPPSLPPWRRPLVLQLGSADPHQRASRDASAVVWGAGRPPTASSAGGTALVRRIQRRHLPATRPPVPTDAVRSLGRRVHPVALRGPTRSSEPPGAVRSGSRPRRPPHSARGARPPRKSAEAPDAGRARPVLEPEGSGTLTCFWQRCMRSTIRSDVRAGHRPRGPRHRTRWLLS